MIRKATALWRALPNDPMMDRTTLSYALLLSIPPGVGVVGFTAMMSGGGLVQPVGVLAGTIVAVAIFIVVFLGASGEDPEPVEGFVK